MLLERIIAFLEAKKYFNQFSDQLWAGTIQCQRSSVCHWNRWSSGSRFCPALPRNQFSRYKECRCCFLLSFRNCLVRTSHYQQNYIGSHFFFQKSHHILACFKTLPCSRPIRFVIFAYLFWIFYGAIWWKEKKWVYSTTFSCSSFAVLSSKLGMPW